VNEDKEKYRYLCGRPADNRGPKDSVRLRAEQGPMVSTGVLRTRGQLAAGAQQADAPSIAGVFASSHTDRSNCC
jgi:hypothetical protein